MKYMLSDIEELYQLYPLKKGKKKGLEKLLKMLNSGAVSFDDTKAALTFYKEEWTQEGILPKYTPHFSTFVNGELEDYIEKAKTDRVSSSVLEDLFKAWREKDTSKLDELGVKYE